IHPEYKVVSSTGSYQADGTLNTNAGGPWAAIIGTYRADPTDHFVVTAPATVGAGNPFSVTVTAADSFNNTATGYTGTVHFSTTDGGTGVVLPANYTFQPGDAGAHTFTGLVLVTAGNQNLTVSDTVNGGMSGTATIAVNAATATSFVVAGYPSPTVAG